MAYQFTDEYMDFGVGALSTVVAGPTTMAVLINLDATTDGAAIHLLTSGNASGAFLECFGSWDYGIGATARVGPAGATGSWRIIVFSKDTGTTSVEWTQIILGGATTSGTATGGTLANGATPPGGTGKIRVGQYAASTTERIQGKIAAVVVYPEYKNQAAREALTTWAAWQAASGWSTGWAVEFTGIGARSDATGNGGNEVGRFGTGTITLVSDPAGFFGGSDVTATDTPGPGLRLSSVGGTAAVGVSVADPGAGGLRWSSVGGSAAVGVTTQDSASAGLRFRSADGAGVVIGTAVADTTPGSFRWRSTTESVVTGVVIPDMASAGYRLAQSPASADVATTVPDVGGAGLRWSSANGAGVISGVVVTDTSSGGWRLRSGADGVAVGVVTADVPSGWRLRDSVTAVSASVVVPDTPNGLRWLSGASGVTVGGDDSPPVDLAVAGWRWRSTDSALGVVIGTDEPLPADLVATITTTRLSSGVGTAHLRAHIETARVAR